MLATFDTLAVPVICGGDLSSLNGFAPTPIRVSVFEKTESTERAVELINNRFARYRSQKTPNDFRLSQIKTDRELVPDPAYKPDFLATPKQSTLELSITPELQGILDSLVATGIYGPTVEYAVLAAFLRWDGLRHIVDRIVALNII